MEDAARCGADMLIAAKYAQKIMEQKHHFLTEPYPNAL
jgi:hypothetical protein